MPVYPGALRIADNSETVRKRYALLSIWLKSMLHSVYRSIPGGTMDRQGEIESPRFLWVAALTIAVSVAVVLGVRAAAVRILHPSPTFVPLALGPPIIDTIFCVVVAIFVFLKISSYPNCVRLWRYVATVVLVLSFIPDVLLAISRNMGGGWPEACALMMMHIVVWAICVTLLPGLAFTTPSPRGSRRDNRLSIL
jgi:uncharacterized membrane protein YhaH (DUF805 family)